MEITKMRFDDVISAVEWAEENIKEDFEVRRMEDGSYVVREVFQ